MDTETITRCLLEKRAAALAAFLATPTIHPLSRKLYTTFTQLDFEQYHEPLKAELRQLVSSWPTTVNQPLDALFFDFDFYSIYDGAVPTQTYGLLTGQVPQLHRKGLMLDTYDLAPGFEALPGPTLSFLAPLQTIYNEELPAEWKVIALWDLPGSPALEEAYLFSGLLVLQRVLQELNHEQAFADLPLKQSASFLAGSLDWRTGYPLLRKLAE